METPFPSAGGWTWTRRVWVLDSGVAVPLSAIEALAILHVLFTVVAVPFRCIPITHVSHTLSLSRLERS
jgi:hypothetical protein